MVKKGEMWSELALVAIAVTGQADVDWGTRIDSINISQGNKNIEVFSTTGGGRLVGFNPEEPTEIDLVLFPIGINSSAGEGAFQLFVDTFANWDATAPDINAASRNRDPVRVAILWSDDLTVTGANDAIASGSNGFRFVAANGWVTQHNFDFTDKNLKTTMKVVIPPFTKTGVANYKAEYVADSDSTVLAALGSYTYASDGATNW